MKGNMVGENSANERSFYNQQGVVLPLQAGSFARTRENEL